MMDVCEGSHGYRTPVKALMDTPDPCENSHEFVNLGCGGSPWIQKACEGSFDAKTPANVACPILYFEVKLQFEGCSY